MAKVFFYPVEYVPFLGAGFEPVGLVQGFPAGRGCGEVVTDPVEARAV